MITLAFGYVIMASVLIGFPLVAYIAYEIGKGHGKINGYLDAIEDFENHGQLKSPSQLL